jgi:hypothetical protein
LQIAIGELLEHVLGAQRVVQLKLQILYLCLGIREFGLGELELAGELLLRCEFPFEIRDLGLVFPLGLCGDVS